MLANLFPGGQAMDAAFRAGEYVSDDRVCEACGADNKTIIAASGGQMLVCSNDDCEFYGEDCGPTIRERAADLGRTVAGAARAVRNTARGLLHLVTDTRGRRRTFTVRAVMHRGILNRSWCWCLMFGTLEGCSGAGYIGGFTFYVARRCYFQPRGDYRTRFAHIGLTMNANRPPLTTG